MKISRWLLLLGVAGLILPAAAQAHDHHDSHRGHDWRCGHDWNRGGYYRGGPYIGFGFYSPSFYYGPDYYDAPLYYGAYAPAAPRVYTATRYDSIPMDVQLALSRRGYYHGVIDGDIGPASRAAIRAYQRDHGLRATGRIDDPLLEALRV